MLHFTRHRSKNHSPMKFGEIFLSPKIFIITALCFMLFSMTSCEDAFTDAQLDIYITGTLSGNPRSGIEVTLYLTKSDAEDETNEVTSPQITEEDGKTLFFHLDPGIKYWVRSDVVLTYIKQTDELRSGYNEFRFQVI